MVVFDNPHSVPQNKAPEWTWSQEREYMENIVNTRVNYIVIVFGVVLAGMASAQGTWWIVALPIAGVCLIGMMALAVFRAQKRFDYAMQHIEKTQTDNPISMTGRSVDASARKLCHRILWGRSKRWLVGYCMPAFCWVGLLIVVALLLVLPGMRHGAQDGLAKRVAEALVQSNQAANQAKAWTSAVEQRIKASERERSALSNAESATTRVIRCVDAGRHDEAFQLCLDEVLRAGAPFDDHAEALAEAVWRNGTDAKATAQLLKLVQDAGLPEAWEITAKWIDAEMLAKRGATSASTLKAEATRLWIADAGRIASAQSALAARIGKWRSEAELMARAARTWENEAKELARAKGSE